jgi:Lon protease-like protein
MEANASELPLFPLSLVLFPGEPLPLFIFEPRYRIMINRCIEKDEPFGVVLAYEDNVPASVGTSARVTSAKRRADGCIDIETVGEARFKIESLRESEHGFLVGKVTFEPVSGDARPELTASVARRTRRYLKLYEETNGVRFSLSSFPTDARQLAEFAAIALRLPLSMRQQLLDHESLENLLSDELEMLREEIAQMSVMARAVPPPEPEHGFFPN